MKPILPVLFLLACTGAVRAQHLTISSSPETGAVSVPIETSVHLRFSAPIDTSLAIDDEPPIAFFVSPLDSISVDFFVRHDEDSSLVFNVRHAHDTDYTWIVTGARGRDGTTLRKPFILRYTTAPGWGERTVSGEVGFIVAVKRGADIFSTVVALLKRPLVRSADGTYEEFESVAAADTISDEGEFAIHSVRDGTYWPVAFLDEDEDGRLTEADWFTTYSSESGDSIVVAGEDVSDIFMSFPGGGAAEIPGPPSIRRLDSPHPNPAGTEAGVEFELERHAAVSISVYNLLGQEVARVLDGAFLPEGSHHVTLDVSNLPNGAYLCRLHVDESSESRALIVMK